LQIFIPWYNHVAKVVEENIVQIPIQDTKPIDKAIVEEVVTKQIDTTQIQSIEDAYLSKIRSEIEKNKTYPKVAKRLNQTGKVYITFLVTKDGVIKNCRINKSSNFESLDEASLETLMKIANFEAIPKELNKESWEITVPIVYQIS
jgi:protein TonB